MNKLYILFFLGLFSCNDEIKITSPYEVPKLALIGVIYQGLPLNITLSGSYQFTEEFPDFRVPDAEVILFENDFPIDTLITDLPDPDSPDYAGANLSGTRYYSNEPVFMQEGSSYFIRVLADNYPVLETEEIVFKSTAANLTIESMDDLWATTGEEEVASLTGNVDIIEDIKGKWEIGVKYFFPGDEYSDNISLRINQPPFDEKFAASSFFLNDPAQANHTFLFEYNYQAPSQIVDSVIAAVEITFFESEYLEFKEIIKRGRFEEFVGLQSNIEPLPNNINNGYGFFTLAERYRFIKVFY